MITGAPRGAVRRQGLEPRARTDEWTEQRRYMGIEILAKVRIRTIVDNTDQQEVTPPEALSA